ncbi:hypothetical protein DFP86_1142 [Paludibacterium purpuratum]|uniref:Uncharacterized protein n=1 Tax=Paludibacterium purpuratum TaxID=1144873 RepID=A0A4R7B188_9NEIS|nr:hypothetical protein DFP86_1142 [Paludibacterium purpuratum]
MSAEALSLNFTTGLFKIKSWILMACYCSGQGELA